LDNVKAVVKRDETLAFHWYQKFVVNYVKEMVCNALGWGRDCKIVGLSHEEDPFTKDEAGVDARFMNSWREVNVR
jgi:hypothetical protein